MYYNKLNIIICDTLLCEMLVSEINMESARWKLNEVAFFFNVCEKIQLVSYAHNPDQILEHAFAIFGNAGSTNADNVKQQPNIL